MTKNKMLLSFLLLFFLSVSVKSNIYAEAEEAEDSNFTLGVKLPDNQINKKVTYLDIPIEPGETKEINLVITNTGTSDKRIRVSPTNAITNDNGLIDYNKQHNDYEYDDSLKNPFTSISSKSQTVDVKKGEVKNLKFNLKFPKEEINGLVLGSFVAELLNEEDEINKTSVTILNKFQLIKGVVLHGVDLKNTKDSILLNEVSPQLINYEAAISINIQNIKPQVLSNMTTQAKIYKKNSTVIFKESEMKNVTMAPNSNFNMPVFWDGDKLEQGKYTLKLEIDTNGDIYKFEKDFDVTKKESIDINSDSINKKANNNLYWVIIAIIIAIIIVSLFIKFYINKKKNKKNKRKNKNK